MRNDELSDRWLKLIVGFIMAVIVTAVVMLGALVYTAITADDGAPAPSAPALSGGKEER